MSEGLVETLSMMVTFVFVLPLVLAGIELFFQGRRLLATSLLAVALGMVLFERFVTTPGDIPELILTKIGGAIATEPDEE